MRGNFVWHELMTTDTQSASSFYPRVTGWKTRAWERDSSYTLFEGATGPMGGLMKLPEDATSMGAPPSWLPYLGTQDAAGTIAHAQRLGGRVLKDVQDMPDVGKFAVLADPQGATFAVLQSAHSTPSSIGRPAAGEFSWHELATSDHRAALEFYSELFGWRKGAGHDMGPMGIYQLFTIGGKEAGGMFNKDPDMPAHWLSYVNVSDADAAARAASAAGGKIVNGPMDVPGGDRIAQIRDPQGGAFAVHAFAKAAAAKPAPQPRPASTSTPASQPRPAALVSKPAAGSSPRRAAGKSAARKKARKTAKRRPAARKAATRRRAPSSRKRASSARSRSSRTPARKAKQARKSTGRRARVRRASPRRGATARRTTRRPRRAK
jgi:uncharacterized protein